MAPEAEYAGGRIDASVDEAGRNRNVLYFEDPTADICEYTRLEYDAGSSSTYYEIVVAGEGSFDGATGTDCLPEF